MSAIRVGVGQAHEPFRHPGTQGSGHRTTRHGCPQGQTARRLRTRRRLLCASYFASARQSPWRRCSAETERRPPPPQHRALPSPSGSAGRRRPSTRPTRNGLPTSYANDTLGRAAAAPPTCLSMVYVNLTGRRRWTRPRCAYSERMGFVDKGATSWEFMTKGARGLGIKRRGASRRQGHNQGPSVPVIPSSRSWDLVISRQPATSS